MADDGKNHDDDHDSKHEGFDPWADLESEGTGGLGEDPSFSVEDISLDAEFDALMMKSTTDATGEPDSESVAAAGRASESFVEPTGIASSSDAVGERLESEPPDDDAFVNAWLNDSPDSPDPSIEEPGEVASLSVFAPDDPADLGEVEDALPEAAWTEDPAAIEIGAGQSSVTPASHIEARGVEDDDAFLADDAGEQRVAGSIPQDGSEAEVGESTAAFAAAEADGEGEHHDADVIDFGTAAAGAATLAAVAAGGDPVAVAVKSGSIDSGKRRKRGLLGQLLGVVLGGLLAIPVVLGILIGLMWIGWKDTTGIRTWMPEQLSFLLPQAASSVGIGGPDLRSAATLDALAAADQAVSDVEKAESAPAVDAPVATGEPAPAVLTEESTPTEAVASPDLVGEVPAVPPANDDAPVPSDAGATAAAAPSSSDPLAAPPADPSLDDIAAIASPRPVLDQAPPVAAVSVPAVIPNPEPLDLGSLEAAVADATAALDAVEAVADPKDPIRKSLLVDWYKRLARVAQELATLEHRAVDSGQPLSATPRVAADVGGRILARADLADDLARLARNWLTYSRRDGDGVVMPGTFSGARRVGPYWCSRVSIAEAGGASRELSVISRTEPVAVPGDAVVIMGLVMDGGVLWASDLRSAAAPGEPAAAVEADPFGSSGP